MGVSNLPTRATTNMYSQFIGCIIDEKHTDNGVEIIACNDGIDDPLARIVIIVADVYGVVGTYNRLFNFQEIVESSMTTFTIKHVIVDDVVRNITNIVYRDDKVFITLEKY